MFMYMCINTNYVQLISHSSMLVTNIDGWLVGWLEFNGAFNSL